MTTLTTTLASNAAMTQAHNVIAIDRQRSTVWSGLDGLYTPPFSFNSTGLDSWASLQLEYAKRMIAAAKDAMKQTRKTLIQTIYHEGGHYA